MYPNLADLIETKNYIDKHVSGNCVDKARSAKLNLLITYEWPKEKVNYVNCRTEKKEYHRVVIVNHEGWQYVIDGRLPVMLLDDCPYTDWYGGIGLT